MLKVYKRVISSKSKGPVNHKTVRANAMIEYRIHCFDDQSGKMPRESDAMPQSRKCLSQRLTSHSRQDTSPKMPIEESLRLSCRIFRR